MLTGESKTILLVEDEALIALNEARVLQQYGYRVITAFSGQQAVEIAATTPEIDLVLMDINLGRDHMDGTQAATLILQQRPLPLIFLSSYTERAVVERTEGITSYGYIVKNSGETVLIASIKMAFRLHDARCLEQEKDRALRESEERFRLSMEATQEGLWDWNMATGAVYYSPAYWSMLGYESVEHEPGLHSFINLVHPDDQAATLKANRDCIENRTESFMVEFRMRSKSGEWRWIRGCGKAVTRDAHGQALRMVGTHADITDRKRTEEALEKRMVALTRPLDDSGGLPGGISFADLFNLDDIQRLQDEFAGAAGVASIITAVDGTPITRPSNFCRLCSDIIRQTGVGRQNCYHSDAELGRFNPQGPTIQPCRSGGLWDAGAAISVGGRHIANWLIGQVRDETQTEDNMRAYARQIGADEAAAAAAFYEVPAMSSAQFGRVAQALYTLANQLSTGAYQNVQQARFIAERKQAEAALRQSEANLQEAQRIARLGRWELDLASHRLHWSPMIYEIFEVDPAGFSDTYTAFLDAIHPDDRALVDQAYSQSLVDRLPYNIEHRLLMQDGRVKWVSEICRTEYDAQDRPIRSVGIVQEITERKRVEAIMAARSRLLQLANTCSLEALLTATLDEAEALTGSQVGFYHFVEPDQATLSLQAWSHNTVENLCRAEGAGMHYPVGQAGVWVDCILQRRPVIHNDYASLPQHKGFPAGHAQVVRELVVPVMRGEAIVAVLGVGNKPADYDQHDIETAASLADLAWDVAERKRAEEALQASEERYRTILQTALDGFCLVDMQGRLLEVNAAYCLMSGYSQAELLGMRISDLEAVEDPGEVAAHIQQLQAIGQGSFQSRHRRKDGSQFAIEISAQYKPAEGGQLVVFMRDITARKRAEAEAAAREAISRLFLQGGRLEDTYQLLAETLVVTLDFPIAAIELYDARQAEMVFMGAAGMPGVPTGLRVPVDQTLSGTVATSGRELCETHAGERAEYSFEALRRLEIDTFICVPLHIGDEVAGTLALADRRWRADAQEWVSNLRTIAASLALEIQRKRAEQALALALQEKQDLLRELQHRAKNSFSMITSMIGLMEDAAEFSSAQPALAEVRSRVRALSELYDLLYESNAVTQVRLDEYCARITSTFRTAGRVRFQPSFQAVTVPVKIAAPVGLVLTELITNTIKHAYPDGRIGTVRISLSQADGLASLVVQDDGAGLPPNFDLPASTTLGLTLVQALARQIHGTFRLEASGGTRGEVVFPVEG